MSNRKHVRVSLLLGVAALLGACGGSGDSPSASTVTVSITDAPIDGASSAVVQVKGIAFKAEGSAPEIVQNFTPRALDLLQFQQGRTAVLLDNVPFAAGRYQWLRLLIDAEPNTRDSYIVINGQECELNVPSGAETGLKMIRGFSIAEGGSLALTIDFDLRRSIAAPPGQATGACASGYLLRPALRLVDNANMGAINGTVTFAANSVPVGCKAKVYVYDGTVTPDDMEDSTPANPDIDPVSVIGVDVSNGTSGTFRAAFLPVGTYTAAFTCDDDTEADQTLLFAPTTGTAVTVQNNLISTVNFTVPVPPPAT